MTYGEPTRRETTGRALSHSIIAFTGTKNNGKILWPWRIKVYDKAMTRWTWSNVRKNISRDDFVAGFLVGISFATAVVWIVAEIVSR